MPQALRKFFTLLEFAHLISTVRAVRDAAGSPPEVVRRAAAGVALRDSTTTTCQTPTVILWRHKWMNGDRSADAHTNNAVVRTLR
ncbi:MAG: hypothetical protein ACR2GB_04625 [Nocardioidaceae bacterium]